ncbi:AI-2E family transporter [Kribbella solani]|uniref:Putative PurR-regulated permease PerM n=1 Tax=Kribbella solani TaxID=236067 RepID=A0A841E2X5_9ACTN|nr:AI-2E family transporter [Kribbella solani]MBB5983396.1 putative PurR-regulated permease PerM [Kribbella solani]MDX2972427.1 AI-2E family transporter [Kribbella solani]MDX3004113.1 AI-2E family transporter [Kribbella solani]
MSNLGRDEAGEPERESPVADNEVPAGTTDDADPGKARELDGAGESAGGRRVDTGVTRGMEIASAWSWRFLVIVAAVVVIGYTMRYLSEVVVPVTVGVLLTALLVPVTNGLQKLRVPRGPAAGLTVIATLIVIAGLLTLVGTQIAGQFEDLSKQVGEGVQKLREMARINFGLTDADITNLFKQLQKQFTSGGALGQQAAAVGTTATHVVAGLFIALFCLFFFLYQGEQIWRWLVRLFPRRARDKADSSGRRAWVSLTAFVRATVIVAAVDAIGISLGAAILGLPLVSAIGILVFVGAFVPVVGALVSGVVAVLVALVAKGPIVAIVMLAIVIGVQQLEAHVLQPFLMGRAVSVHPLAVILAIATGVVIAGIVGALVAVPTAAVINAIVNHLAGNDPDPDPPRPLPRRPRPAPTED